MEHDRIMEQLASRRSLRQARERAAVQLPDGIKMRGGPDDDHHPVPAPREAPNALEALHSIAHRCNDIGVNMAHTRNHMLKAMEAVHSGRKADMLFNFDHAQRHMMEIEAAAVKVAESIESHPLLRKEWERLQRDNAMNQVVDPQNSGPQPPRF